MNTKHIYKCSLNEELDREASRYKLIKFNYPFISIKDNLYNEYINNNLSLPDIEKKYGISYSMTLFLLKIFNIKNRSIKESSNLISREKYKITCLEKYGVDNISKLDETKDKKKKTFLKNYGVDNIWKTSDYRKWWEEEMIKKYGKVCLSDLYDNQNGWGWKGIDDESKGKRIKKLNDAYKIWYSNLSDDAKTELYKKIFNSCRKYYIENASKIENRVSSILDDNLISYQRQFVFSNFIYDFKIGNNILIEVNGDFWHANPKIYKESDILNHPFEKKKASDLWNRDRNKNAFAIKSGFIIITLWESDINSMTDDDVIKYIKEKTTYYDSIKNKKDK